MKKIINGRKYDTDTATEIGTCSGGEGPGDFHYFTETLYRKRGGEYFLYGYGQGLSRYAQRSGGAWGPGEAISPLTYEGARSWCEENLSTEEYEAEFGEVSEDGSDFEVISCKVKPASKRSLEKYAGEHGITLAQGLDEILLAL